MKSPLYLLLAAALTLPVAALAAGPSAHGHGTGEPQKVELNAGKKWQIDAPLRQGMGAMRKAVNHTLRWPLRARRRPPTTTPWAQKSPGRSRTSWKTASLIRRPMPSCTS